MYCRASYPLPLQITYKQRKTPNVISYLQGKAFAFNLSDPGVRLAHTSAGLCMAKNEWRLEKVPGGPLIFEVGYHPRKKIHVIRVVFQDQAIRT